jgi:hypothetical protein
MRWPPSASGCLDKKYEFDGPEGKVSLIGFIGDLNLNDLAQQ